MKRACEEDGVTGQNGITYKDVLAMEAMLRFRLDEDSTGGNKEYNEIFGWIVDLFLRYGRNAERDRDRALCMVVMTRRCSTLLELCMQMASFYRKDQAVPNGRKKELPLFFRGVNLSKLLEIVTRCCVTDAAALMLVPKWLEVYQNTGKFPQIVIFDELLLHGRTCNSLLYEMEKILKDCCREMRLDWGKILEDFEKSISIEVYTQCDCNLLLYPRYHRRYRAEQTYTAAQCREMSYKIALAVASNAVCNVSCEWGLISEESRVPFANEQEQISAAAAGMVLRVKDTALNEELTGRPDKLKMRHYLYFYPDISHPKIIGAVRVKHSATTRQKMIVPYLILSDVSTRNCAKTYERICEDFRGTSGEAFFCQYAPFLTHYHKEYNQRFLANSVSLVLCKLLVEYVQKAECQEDNIFQINTRQLARSFGVEKSVIEGLYRAKAKTDLEFYLFTLTQDSEPIWRVDEQASVDDHECDYKAVLHAVQSAVSELGLASEKNAHSYYIRNALYSEQELMSLGSQCTITDLCEKVRLQFEKEYSSSIFDNALMAAYLVQMMDYGVVRFKINALDKKPDRFSTEIFAGEPSLFLKPKNYARYLWALAEVQEKIHGNGTPVLLEVERFVKRIAPPDNMSREQLIQELKLFIEQMDESGQEVSEWNFMVPFHIYQMESIDTEEALQKSIQKIRRTASKKRREQESEQLDILLDYRFG